MKREFVGKNLDGKYVLIRTGVEGYYPYPCTDERAKQVNAVNGNSDSDVDAAMTCSMFGWNLPIADTIS